MIEIARFKILLILFFSINTATGQDLYRSYSQDSIYYSKKISISSFENDFNDNISFYYEISRQSNFPISRHILVESNDTLYYASGKSVFLEKILPNFRKRNKYKKVVKLDFTLGVITKTQPFDSIYNLYDNWRPHFYSKRIYDLDKIKVSKIDTTFLFEKMKMTFNYYCKMEIILELSKTVRSQYLTTYYFIDNGEIIYKYRFFPDEYDDKLNYMKLEFYNMEDNLRFRNMLMID